MPPRIEIGPINLVDGRRRTFFEVESLTQSLGKVGQRGITLPTLYDDATFFGVVLDGGKFW